MTDRAICMFKICMYNENDIVNSDQQFIPACIEFLTRVIEIQNAETRQYPQEVLEEHLYQNNMNEQ